ncbi:MAG: phytoene desaturase family protein [Actinomycetota bacterium]
MTDRHDAVVVGSGPNGLAAAIHLARSGRSVLVLEQEATIGGGLRSAELTLPGFVHDVCSAIHSLALASPFLAGLPLAEHGLELLHPSTPLGQPLDDGRAAVLERSVTATADGLDGDGPAYRRLMEPLVDHADAMAREFLGPLRPPRHPFVMARFGVRALRSAVGLARGWFDRAPARALLGGLAAHSMLPLTKIPSGAVGLLLGTFAHSAGWPVAKGGSSTLADALASYLRSLGGEIRTGTQVASMDDVPGSDAVLFDITPRQLDRIAGDHLPARYRARLRRYRYGPGVFKLDWALDGPIPWTAEACRRTGVVHVGGTLEEMALSEDMMTRGEHCDRPFVLLVQQSVVDPTRAPAGKHAIWAYCHVPSGSTVDMTEAMEAQIERFAPGFRDLILARSAMGPAEMEAHNPNYVGGDINGGIQDLRQLFTRPVARISPYTTPNPRIFICSSSTPPGGGVHGMCGFFGARAALRRAL